MLIVPYPHSSSRLACRNGRFCTALISSGSAARTGAARRQAVMHSGSRRMARTTWEPEGGRATPCGRARGNQFSARMYALRPAGGVVRSTLAVALAATLAGGCALTDLGAPCPLPGVHSEVARPLHGRGYL